MPNIDIMNIIDSDNEKINKLDKTKINENQIGLVMWVAISCFIFYIYMIWDHL